MSEYLNNKFKSNNNANENTSAAGLEAWIVKRALEKYTYSVYDGVVPDAMRLHREGDFYIHDMAYSVFKGYCSGHDLHDILVRGLNFPSITSRPPRHVDSAVDQVINYISGMSQEWVGAQAFPDFDVLFAPFVKADGLSQRQVKQAMQRFVFNTNFPYRSGFQSPFVNVTLRLKCPKRYANMPTTVGGYVYGDLQDEIAMIDHAIFEILSEGDGSGRPFPFPIPTIMVNRDNGVFEGETWRGLFETCARKGSFYFMPVDDEDMAYSMCCHLHLDKKQLVSAGGVFAMGVKTGSLGVVTINMPRLGLTCKTIDEVMERLEYLVERAAEYLAAKRAFVGKSMENNMLPITREYFGTLAHHFNTVSWVGMNEFWRNFDPGSTLVDHAPETRKLLNFVNRRLGEIQGTTGEFWNFEAAPAETAAARLAWLDYEKFGGKCAYFGDPEIGIQYNPGTTLDRGTAFDLCFQAKFEGQFSPLYSGGSVTHFFLNEQPPAEVLMDLTEKIIANTELNYFTWTPTISVCERCSRSWVGTYHECLVQGCGRETLIYTRVVGYYAPKQSMHPAKIFEVEERVPVDIAGGFDPGAGGIVVDAQGA